MKYILTTFILPFCIFPHLTTAVKPTLCGGIEYDIAKYVCINDRKLCPTDAPDPCGHACFNVMGGKGRYFCDPQGSILREMIAVPISTSTVTSETPPVTVTTIIFVNRSATTTPNPGAVYEA
ncbi:hypothetical protein P167DRAFT_542437 [Morchella conica CCBAS932]|uniref:Endo-1,3(4)-beta-glucanase 1 carbohydrate binding domain-containing protein n=1 Tax=Morchella conica CCBAS932 TaxID=1392247 RepID=A0A3N4L351_9PEZI|nr:hypothetical protein P167DRAFT_542437 [Morchella conica CCBAS932]